MSSCHLTAGCSAETRCHTQPVSHAQGTPQLTSLYLLPPQSHSSRQSCASSTGGGSTPQCLEGQADSHDRELLHAQQFFSWSALAVTLGDWEGTGTHTHTPPRTSHCRLSLSSLCAPFWWLRWQGCASEGTEMALPSEFPFWLPSRQDGSGHG